MFFNLKLSELSKLSKIVKSVKNDNKLSINKKETQIRIKLLKNDRASKDANQ
jgi:hypothetical protein